MKDLIEALQIFLKYCDDHGRYVSSCRVLFGLRGH